MASRPTWLEEQKSRLNDGVRSLERVTDEVIQSFAAELKGREETLLNDMKKGDEQRQILSDRLNEEIAKNRKLEAQNGRLRRHITDVDPDFLLATTEDDSDVTGPIQSIAEERLVDKYNNLHQLYQENMQRLKYLERKNVAVMQKNREMKESVRAWQQYSERHHDKQRRKSLEETKIKRSASEIRDSENNLDAIRTKTGPSENGTNQQNIRPKPSSPISANNPPGADLSETPECALRSHSQFQGDGFGPLPSSPSAPFEEQLDQNPVEPLLHDTGMMDATDRRTMGFIEERCTRISSSQTTEDDIAADHRIEVSRPMLEDDDDLPQVVSERSLKRKRAPIANTDEPYGKCASDGSMKRPHKIKEEPRSSPPLPDLTHILTRNETLDLDVPGPTVIATPHHRQKFQVGAIAGLHSQRSSSVPLIKEEDTGTRTTGIVPQARTGPRRIDNDGASGRGHSEPSQVAPMASRALRTLDPNARNSPVVEKDFKRRKSDQRARDNERYRILAESGTERLPGNENNERLTPSMARARFNNRMKNLRTPSKGANNSLDSPVSRVTGTYTEQLPTPPSTLSRGGNRNELTPASRTGLGSAARPTGPSVWPTPRNGFAPRTTAQSPLRTKALSELKLSDFKANPTYNQGYSYPFTETVRNRADRACLSGCTRPECCGSAFRIMAEAAPPLSSSQEEDLLRDNLGDAYDDTRLTQMSAEERRELVLQARTRQMANKHGKHRQAYERPKSPPGFWRIDFPTTQEEIEDRERAVQMEREQIQERRAEAMRKGGKWIFRDE
ncbi:SAE2-domain-containing protein [Aaosphaeria arxii CBS 175.79]|uniref:SAE2-domain-containing protein n=1 Tax=Aaosphaeria arxii CBS 175.79 TaxID=1450172 RepID=A0A6A5XTU9_9PLEO|nr:SAE2-domain-containing protein [Aaosphaeria arxii CBS 175.79]KAF2016622.1 SAE2-domain-containing protein [Aaosphaeria arxii CBS 175.79]